MRRSPRSGRVRGPAALTAVLLVAGPVLLAAGADDETPPGPRVFDPLDDGEVPSTSDIQGQISAIEERVSTIDPRVATIDIRPPRELQTEEREGEVTEVTVGADVLFAFDSAELSDRAASTLEDLAERIEGGDGEVLVVGHTDSVGTDDYNQTLSEERAEAVAERLNELLDGDRDIVTEGRGANEPVAEESDDTPEAAQENRRVEVSFTEPD